MFSVEYDRAANVLRISVKGFWEPEQVAPLSDAIGAAVGQGVAAGGNFDTVIESFEFPVQANDVADLLGDIMTRNIGRTTGRTAVVVGSQLNKLQAERTLFHPRVGVFRSMPEAEDWLAGRG